MITFQISAFLGIIQGITEFLPISSSAHLILIPKISGLSDHLLVFDTTLHLGTAFALIIYFWKELIKIIEDFFKRKSTLLLKLAVGSVPAVILGFLFESYFETIFRGVFSIAVFLILGSLLMAGAEKFTLGKEKISIDSLNYPQSLLIGIFQSLALFPGVSRSASTISGGMLLGLNRSDSARFSFLLSIPVVLGAGGYKALTSFSQLQQLSLASAALGFLASFLVGLVAISFLLKYLKNNTLWLFIWYRILLAIFLLFI